MKFPTSCDVFLGDRDELNELNRRLSYFYVEKLIELTESIRALERFEFLLNQIGTDDGSINLQEHWVLYHQITGNIDSEILHRENEIRLVQRLLSIGEPIGPFNETYLNRLIEIVTSLKKM